MASKKIHAVPVWDEEEQMFLGIVDYLDFVCYLFKKLPKDETLNDPDEIEKSYKKVMNTEVGDICNFGGKNPYNPLSIDVSAKKVIHKFAKGIHRIPLQDEKEELKMTISKTAYIHFLLPFFEVDELGSKSLDQLGIGTGKELVLLKETDSVINGFLEIDKRKIYALPVVDKDGKIIGNISASDVNQFSKDHIPSFTVDAVFWLKTHNSVSPITCTKDETFYNVLKTLTKVHRVWIVDEDKKPIGVISQTDVFKYLKTLIE